MHNESQADDFDLIEYVKGDLFDFALFIGMASDEYWFGDPSLIYNYTNAYNKKQEYDLQMIWAMGTYFKSALGSTPIWCNVPFKSSDWKAMPKYAENPIKHIDKPKPLSKEKQDLLEKMKQGLLARGLWEKDN